MDAANDNLNLENVVGQIEENGIQQQEAGMNDIQRQEADVQESLEQDVQALIPEEVKDDSKKRKKVRTHASLAKNIASIVFFMLSLVLGTAAGTLYLVRESLTPQIIEESVKNMTIGDIGIGFWYGYQGQDITLDEYMTDVFNSSGVVAVQQKDVKKLLDSGFIKSFIADRFNGYVSDFMYGTGEGCISVDEVMKLLDDNWEEVSTKLGIDSITIKEKTQSDIKSEVLEGVLNKLIQDIHFGSFTLSNFRKEYPVAMNVASSVITYPAIIVMSAVTVLLWFIILFMNIRYCGGFRYIGRCMSAIGIVSLAAAGAMYVLPVMLNGLFGLGYDFYISFFTLQVTRALYIGTALFVCGLLITFAGKVLRAIRKRILRRKLT